MLVNVQLVFMIRAPLWNIIYDIICSQMASSLRKLVGPVGQIMSEQFTITPRRSWFYEVLKTIQLLMFCHRRIEDSLRTALSFLVTCVSHFTDLYVVTVLLHGLPMFKPS